MLPAALARGLRETSRGDATGGLRSAAIVGGFTAAMIGFLAGRAALAILAMGIQHRRSATVTAGIEKITI